MPCALRNIPGRLQIEAPLISMGEWALAGWPFPCFVAKAEDKNKLRSKKGPAFETLASLSSYGGNFILVILFDTNFFQSLRHR